MLFSTLTSTNIIAFGILIGISFVLNRMSTNTIKGLLGYVCVVSAILFYGEVIDLWIFILSLIIYVSILYRSLNLNSNIKIMLPLVNLLILTLFTMIFTGTSVGTVIDNVVSNESLVDGVSTTFETTGSDLLFGIDFLTGAITWIAVIIALVGVLGINIFGTGLNDWAVRVITIGVTYTAIWVIFSLYTSVLIFEIEIFGYLMYVIFTISYAIGVIEKITGGI